jgi:Bacterial Ig-like domain (group 3)
MVIERMREQLRTTTIPRSGATFAGRLRVVVLALLALAATLSWANTTRGPDAGGYIATDSAVYSFVDISSGGSGTSVLSGTDDGSVPLTLPFPFQFYGQSYSMVCVSSNGALYFIASAAACGAAPNDFANTDLTVAPPPNDSPALLPFWSDLTFAVPGAGSVIYQTLGAPGSRRFVVQWNNAYPQGSQSPVTFEAVLFESGNKILFQYQNVELGAGDPNSQAGRATIGIHNSGGLQSGQQLPWSYDARVLANSTALQFSNQPTIVATTTTISSSLQPSILGQSVTFTAVVNPSGAGTPTGTITFKDGATPLGSSPLSGGKATLTTTSLSIGTHLLTAAYGGDTNFSGSTSAGLPQNVTYNVCLLYDPTKSKNSGAVFPIKVQLCDAAGGDLSSSGVVLHAAGMTSVSGFSGPADSVGDANPDNDFRFDSSLGPTGGYIFNLSTKGLSSGTYSLQFTATGDPVTHSVAFGVK